MATQNLTTAAPPNTPPKARFSRCVLIAGIIVAGLLVALVVLLTLRWPFTPRQSRKPCKSSRGAAYNSQDSTECTFLTPGLSLKA